jgi:hypothetical protein
LPIADVKFAKVTYAKDAYIQHIPVKLDILSFSQYVSFLYFLIQV